MTDGPRWRFLNFRRIENSLEGQHDSTRIAILLALFSVLENPHDPNLFWFIQRVGEYAGAHIAYVTTDWFLAYEPHDSLPPLGHVIVVRALVHSPPR